MTGCGTSTCRQCRAPRVNTKSFERFFKNELSNTLPSSELEADSSLYRIASGCKGTVRSPRAATGTPTGLSGQEPRKSRLVAPFYDVFTYSKYSLVVGTVTQSESRIPVKVFRPNFQIPGPMCLLSIAHEVIPQVDSSSFSPLESSVPTSLNIR